MNAQEALIRSDISLLLQSGLPVSGLEGHTVLVTGVTGLLGSLLAKTLLAFNQTAKAPIRVLGLARNREKAAACFADWQGDPNLRLYFGDVLEPVSIPEPVDYVVHGASVTSSQEFVRRPVETIWTALRGTENLLSFAREKAVKGFVYLSSLEVYGVLNREDALIGEGDYGPIDPMSVRSSYSEGKRMAECLCASYAAEYGVPVKVARLTQTFGAGVDPKDSRVFAEFARCAVLGNDIVLHTKGETVRNYCYTMDAVSAVLTILLQGGAGEAYNVANEATAVSIYEMAVKVSRLAEKPVQVRVEAEADVSARGYNPTVKLALSTEKLRALGWTPRFSLDEMFRRLVESIRCGL